MGTPLYPKDMGTEWMNLKRQVNDAFTSANSRSAYAKIGAGVLSVFKSIQIQAGAFLSFKFANNVTGLFMGRHKDGSNNDIDGMIIRRQDNTLAFWLYSRVSDGYAFYSFYDQAGNTIFSEDGTSGKGIARPWIPYTFWNTSEIANPPSIRQNSGTTDLAIISTMVPQQHSWMAIDGYVYVATAGATVEVKVKDLTSGQTLYAGTWPDGFMHADFLAGDYYFGQYKQIDITVRRASGSGNVGFTCLSLMGRQSP